MQSIPPLHDLQQNKLSTATLTTQSTVVNNLYVGFNQKYDRKPLLVPTALHNLYLLIPLGLSKISITANSIFASTTQIMYFPFSLSLHPKYTVYNRIELAHPMCVVLQHTPNPPHTTLTPKNFDFKIYGPSNIMM